MKLGIIGGAGLIGSSAAFLAGVQKLVSDITLVDINKKMLMSHVMDMSIALKEYNDVSVKAGEYADLDECDIIIISASLPERNVKSRNEYLKGNLSIVESICTELNKLSSEKIVIMATNPIDVFNYIAWKKLKWNRSKFIGFSYNDSIRLKWALSKAISIDYSGINAMTLGEHGDGQIPLYNKATYHDKLINPETKQIETAKQMVSNWFTEYQGLQSGRTTGWTSAVGLVELVRRIVNNDKTHISASAILNGEYGLTNVSIGVPVMLCENGIEKIESISLEEETIEQLKNTASKIQRLINSVGY
ncbi:MAG: malate dehydrogenase [Christensenellales bacterium]|jgi:malate dehydrogenase